MGGSGSAEGAAPADKTSGVARVRALRARAGEGWAAAEAFDEALVVEEPLELRIEGQPAAVTMRTPGDDLDLAAGFLYTEGVIDGWDDVAAMAQLDDPLDPRGNTVHIRLSPGVPALRARAADRALFASSSCGVCGKASIDRVIMKQEPLPLFQPPPVEVVLGMPAALRAAQPRFDATGGLHAAGLFHLDGRLELAREDVGRHNAVDKVIGARLRAEACPIPDRLLVVSGRVGMEIVQKALVARIPGIVSVGPPSSLAVELAQAAGMFLAGFVREGRLNRYDRGAPR
jgi:FdhD protein